MAGRQGYSTYHTKRWMNVRKLVIERDRRRCRECGVFCGRPEVDHIIPIAKGGSRFGLENLQTLCRQCHIAKTVRENTTRSTSRDPERKAFRALVNAV